MNAFHPALTGVLYGALAQHEQALIQMALAVNVAQIDVDDETAERYTGIVDGLKKMIAMTKPSELGSYTGIDAVDKMRRHVAVVDHIMLQIPDFEVFSFDFSRYRGIKACTNCRYQDKDVRAAMREIAGRLGLAYREERHGKTGATFNISAQGQIDGVDVEIYELITAERPFCDTHDVMVDAAGVCPECPAADDAGHLLAELRRFHIPEPHGDDAQVCIACSEEQEAPVLWPCLPLRSADVAEDAPSADAGLVLTSPPDPAGISEYDPGDPDYEVGTEAGNCPGCDGWHQPPWCDDVSAEPDDDETESTFTEPPGDAP